MPYFTFLLCKPGLLAVTAALLLGVGCGSAGDTVMLVENETETQAEAPATAINVRPGTARQETASMKQRASDQTDTAIDNATTDGLTANLAAQDPRRAGWSLVEHPQMGEARGQWRDGALTLTHGKWVSPDFAVSPLGYYRVSFETRADSNALWAVVFYDADGEQLAADHYSQFDASDDRREHVFHVRARHNAATARLWFHPAEAGNSLELYRLDVQPATAAQVRAWSESVYAQLAPVEYTPSPDRWAHLPRTMSKLQAGERVRIVMLGDSIMNDTSNSCYETLVEPLYPGARIELITSVRGGTGCWWYREEDRVRSYVVDKQPDLLMIGGISQRGDVEAIVDVIHQVRAAMDPAPEILLLSKIFGRPDDYFGDAWSYEIDPEDEHYRSKLFRAAAEMDIELFDLSAPWGQYVREQTGQPYDVFLRDAIHANARGRAIAAQLMARYFAPRSAE